MTRKNLTPFRDSVILVKNCKTLACAASPEGLATRGVLVACATVLEGVQGEGLNGRVLRGSERFGQVLQNEGGGKCLGAKETSSWSSCSKRLSAGSLSELLINVHNSRGSDKHHAALVSQSMEKTAFSFVQPERLQ